MPPKKQPAKRTADRGRRGRGGRPVQRPADPKPTARTPLHREPDKGQPLTARRRSGKTYAYEIFGGGPITIDDDTLEEITRQALKPNRATRLYGWTYLDRFSTQDVATYARGDDVIMAIDSRNSPGSVGVNMGETQGAAWQRHKMIAQEIKAQNQNARVMTTGSSVGANLRNSDQAGLMEDAVTNAYRWASNR